MFWCQTSSVSPRGPDLVRILPDPGWFSGSRTLMERLKPKVKKKAFKTKKSPSLSSYRAPDPFFLANPRENVIDIKNIIKDRLDTNSVMVLLW